MRARYPGTCWFCAEPFAAGDEISRWGESWDRQKGRLKATWGHQECAKEYASLMEASKPSTSAASGRRRVLTRRGWRVV